MDLLDENFLWASLFWGAIGSAYLLYGWRQRSVVPFTGGVALTIASFFLPALWMSLAGVSILLAVWWLLKQDN